MQEIVSAIKSLCDAFDRLPDTDTPLEDMQAKGIDRGKYDATLPIRRNLRKAVDFLRVFGDEASAPAFVNLPKSFAKAVLADVRSLYAIAKEIPDKCRPQMTSAVPPGYHGQEQATADKVDQIHARLLSNLSFLSNALPSLIQSPNEALHGGTGKSADEWQRLYVSYAWGDISPSASTEDRQRQELVERMCQFLQNDHWLVIRDKTALRYGDNISTFLSSVGQADLIVVVLSSKYLHSPYCMTELYDIYRRSLAEKDRFLQRILPLVLSDARIGTWRDRVSYAKHWEQEFQEMEKWVSQLGEADLKLYKAMRRWQNEVSDMLAYIADKLSPHGFEEIVEDDFKGLRKMLSLLRST
jgi:hypothetical protein